MAACKPVRLCALVFVSGKRCGSPALRNQPYCYHHAGNHQAYTRDRYLCDRLGRIREKLDAMPASALLNFLHQQLCNLPKTLHRFPEIDFTLTYTLDRIEEITALESVFSSFLQQNQELAPMLHRNPKQTGNLHATALLSTT
jgi:hypothetical protein